MHLEVVSPEAVLFSSEVDSIAVPGARGEFQMLNNSRSYRFYVERRYCKDSYAQTRSS